MNKKRSLLGPHRADDDEYWEHFTDGMVLPGGAKKDQAVVNDDKEPSHRDSEYYMKVLPPEMRSATCWDLFRAWLGIPSLLIYPTGQKDKEYLYDALERHNQLRKVHTAKPIIIDPHLCSLARRIVNSYATRGKMDGQPTSFPRERRVYGKLCTESLIYAEGRPGYSYLTGYQATQEAYDYRRAFKHKGEKFEYKKYLAVIWKSVARLGVARLTVLTHSYGKWKATGSKTPVERTYVVFLYFPEIHTEHGRALDTNVAVVKKVQSIIKRDSVGDKEKKRSGVSLVTRTSLISDILPTASQENSSKKKKERVKEKERVKKTHMKKTGPKNKVHPT